MLTHVGFEGGGGFRGARGGGGYGGGFHGDNYGMGGAPRDFGAWNRGGGEFHGEDDFRKAKEGGAPGFQRGGLGGPGAERGGYSSGAKRERSRSGEKENARQGF